MITNEVRKILKISEYINLLEFNRVKSDIINQQIPRLMKMSVSEINKEFLNISSITNDVNNINPEPVITYKEKRSLEYEPVEDDAL